MRIMEIVDNDYTVSACDRHRKPKVVHRMLWRVTTVDAEKADAPATGDRCKLCGRQRQAVRLMDANGRGVSGIAFQITLKRHQITAPRVVDVARLILEHINSNACLAHTYGIVKSDKEAAMVNTDLAGSPGRGVLVLEFREQFNHMKIVLRNPPLDVVMMARDIFPSSIHILADPSEVNIS